jgi:hypothetical protein
LEKLEEFSTTTADLSRKLLDTESIMDQIGCIGDVIETLLTFAKPWTSARGTWNVLYVQCVLSQRSAI